jgi:hypothetical protein
LIAMKSITNLDLEILDRRGRLVRKAGFCLQ